MGKSALKYIQIRHWDYWWSVYQCGGASPACPNAVEFSLTDDREGKTLFFHFDLYNLSGLQDILRENTFIETDHPDHATFLHKAKLWSGARSLISSVPCTIRTLCPIWPSATKS